MIPVQNIYYMLSYAFQSLNNNGCKSIATEQFTNSAELCAAILAKGISVQIKRGLGQTYLSQREALSSLRGKLDITDSIKTQTMLRKKMICEYEEFTVNSYINRIIKSTVELLLRSRISADRKRALRKYMIYFQDVDTLNIYTIDWHLQYNRHNCMYRMLISVCYLVIKGLLQTQADGSTRIMDYFDEQRMCRLYEKFLLEYFKKEYPQITTRASQIRWKLDDGYSDLLPIMQSDIMLTFQNQTLIIDAKYYSHTTLSQYNRPKLHSGNLYQIFTYVKNKNMEYREEQHEVSGMLLYAKTDESIVPNQEYSMSGNRISAKTLDLNCSFSEVVTQLQNIIESHFGCIQVLK